MQTTSDQFSNLAVNEVRPISYDLTISFDKVFDDAITFFTLDTSILDGTDVLAPNDDNPLQYWDKYEYQDFADRAMSLETSAEIEFPYSVASAVADFTLNNYDDLFTPNSGSSIAPYVLPSRPLRMFMGFNGENLQQFVGLTEFLPTVDENSKSVDFHAVDFLSKVFEMKTANIIAMQDVYTSDVLDVLFQAAGLDPSQYSLANSSNKIEFVYFKKGENLGEVIRRLMQAELGLLWLDEQGIIQFKPRAENASDPVMSFDDSNIIEIKTANAGRIINVVEINATIREVEERQPIFSAIDTVDDGYIIPASSSGDIFANLDDPAISATAPTSGLSNIDSYFIATNAATGASVGSVTVTSDDLFVDSYKVTFNNANAFDVRISSMVIWGEPAKIVDEIRYVEKDQDSIDKYEERGIVIDNDFVQSVSACDSIALSILDSYAEYGGDIEMVVKGNPALQLGDYVAVDKDTFTGDYRVTSKTSRIINGRLDQIIGARKFSNVHFFVLDEDILDGTAQLAP